MSQDRRTFVKSMAASLMAPALRTATAAPTPDIGSQQDAAKTRPNVVLMICDDLGYGDLGCYGSAIPTPNLDRLAAQGTRYMRHNSAHPICSASRAALLTGRYAPRSHTPGALFPHSKGVDKNERTLANLFKDAGYQTHAIGKWHLGDVDGYWPTDRGFHSFYGVPYSDDMKPLPLMRNVTSLDRDTDRDELTPRYTEEALKVLENGDKRPFFLYLAYSYPHDPARGSKAFKGRSQFGDVGDSIEEIDWSVGMVMDALAKSGRADNTVVIFTSDHGPWFQGSAGKTRGRKGSTFEGGVRVPFLIRWTDHIPAATVSGEWSNHLNLLPTLSHWCGLSKSRLPLDGFDASATFLHGDPAPAKPVLYFTPVGNMVVHCIRVGAWKLRVAQSDGQIYINDRPGSTGNYLLPKPELYNLHTDPMESYDVAKKHPEIVRQLQTQLDEEIQTFPQETQQAHAALQKNVASVVTPPGATPRILTGPQPDWAWEPEDRR
ncbi:sulfatase-like hydrolase/transferase [Granulicella sp. dw_53]|uniref:sulfatase-like hydrolase/transferase n=1 Tax=Granulicella sp. dw_53 TaxID=2719792 RepID=UPI001BD55469|nr:sulfatase-like hydrolase/transferase [Granulicella sp. dw_53]